MIDLKPLKNESTRFPEPLRSVIEMTKDSMSDQDFIDLVIQLRRKSREMDAKQREVSVR